MATLQNVVEEDENEMKVSTEERFLEELESKIRDGSLSTELVIDPTIDQKKSTQFTDHEKCILEQIKNNPSEIFISAVKCEKVVVVDFLIKCGVNVNATNVGNDMAADIAWAKKNYKILLSLLKADSFFPVNFNLVEINEDDVDAKEIKNLIERRNHLHELIATGDVEDIKNIQFNEDSKLYLNTANQSAAYVALKSEKFTIYAYLKSVGAEFGRDEEKLQFDKLKFKENVALQEAMVQYFPAQPDGHLHYLISKSRSQKPVTKLSYKLKNYYKVLNGIPEVSIILKVIQYADYLDIIFDFDEEEISKVYPLVSSKCCSRGETVYKLGRIFIAAGLKKRTKEEILGTIAHELTHMAMQILYENDCNPYGKSDESIVDFFRVFKSNIRKVSEDPAKILLDAIDKYRESDHDSELIVRVPHILAQFKNGRDWLEQQVPEFLEFYKKTIVPKCQRYVNESVILKPKSITKSINESVGEIVRLKNCQVFFKNTPTSYQSDDAKIFVCIVKSTLLGMMKVLQGLYGKGFLNFHSNFLVLKLKNFVNQLREIGQAFFLEGCKWLIIENSLNPTEDELNSVCEKISELLEIKPNKKIIFVTNQKSNKLLREMLEVNDLLDVAMETIDQDFSFDSLDDDSQNQILRKRVTFQGKPILLKKLFQTPELCKFINSGMIETLLEGGKVNVGNEIFGMSSLEGCYSDIIQTMDYDSFLNCVTNFDDFFIVRTADVTAFNNKFDEKFINTEFLTTKQFEKAVSGEKIFLVNDRFNSTDFKKFCKMNPNKKCHLVEVKDLNLNLFVLKEIFNPEFYVERKVKKIFVKQDKMIKVVCKINFETFLVTGNDRNSILMKYSNVKWVTEEEAKIMFKNLKVGTGTIHWFQMEDEYFTWKHSHGSVKNLLPYIHKDDDSEELIKEKELISEIIDKNIVVIADNPGMGKTTTLTKLYETKSIANSHWIIRVNLKQHVKAIKGYLQSHEPSVENTIQFLQEIEPSLKNELNENLLRTVLAPENKFSKCLLLAFDGFDEVLDEDDRENIINFIRFLKTETPCKIWITSRLQYKYYLQYTLDTFAFEFHPLDEKAQILFIEKYLKDRLSLIINPEIFQHIFSNEESSKIRIFTSHLLLKMKNIFRKDVGKFIGTPLQLTLVMSGSLEYFKNWAEENNTDVKLEFLGNDLIEVYENFIGKKYEIYFKKCDVVEKTFQERDKKYSEKYNKSLSESLIYERKVLKPEDADIDAKIILLIGLIVSQYEKNFEFVHFTIREYYFAKVFTDYVLSPTLFEEKMIFLFKEIFVKSEYWMIRTFVNLRLKEKIPEAKTEQLKTLLLQNNDVLKSYTTYDSPLNISTEQGHENIFNFIYSIYYHKSPEMPMTNILNETVFKALSNSIFENSPVLKVLFKILGQRKSLKKWEYAYYQCLICNCVHLTKENKKWELIRTLLEGIREILADDEVRLLLQDIWMEFFENCNSFEAFQSFWDVAGKVGNIEWQKIFVDQFCLEVVVGKKDPRFLQLFFQKCDLMTPEEECKLLTPADDPPYFDENVLHRAVENGQLEVCRLVWEKIQKRFDIKKQGEFLKTMKHRTGFNALELAVCKKHIKIVKFLVEKGEEIFKETESFLEFLTISTGCYSDLTYESNFESIEFLFKKWEETKATSSTKNNKFYVEIFLWVCSNGDLTSFKFVFGKLKHLLTPEELRRIVMKKSDLNQTGVQNIVERKPTEFVAIFEEVEECLLPKDQQELFLMRNQKNETILHITAKRKQNVIKLIEKMEEVLNAKKMKELFIVKDLLEEKTFFHFVVQNFPIETINTVWSHCEKLITPSDRKYFILLTGRNILLEAVHDLEVVKFIFEKMEKHLDLKTQGEMLMVTDDDGNTCLHFACRGNQSELLKLFFEKMKKILPKEDQSELFSKKNNREGNTILHVAAKHQEHLLELLFEKMEEILTIEKKREFFAMTNNSGETVVSIRHLTFDFLKLILEKAEYILTDEQLRRFLFPADKNKGLPYSSAFYKEYKSFSLILEKSEKILQSNKATFTHFLDRLASKDVKILKQFLKYMSEKISPEIERDIFNTNKQKLFDCIADHRDEKAALLLLKKLESALTPNDQRQLIDDFLSRNRLHEITNTHELNRIKLIFYKLKDVLGKDITNVFMIKDSDDNSLLHTAMSGGQLDVAKFLLEEGKAVLTPKKLGEFLMMTNKLNQTVLHVAVDLENLFPMHFYFDNQAWWQNFVYVFLNAGETVLNLEERRNFLMAEDNDHKTALHLAVENGQWEASKLLLLFAKKYLSIEDFRKFSTAKDEFKFHKMHVTFLGSSTSNRKKYNPATLETLITTFAKEEINFEPF